MVFKCCVRGCKLTSTNGLHSFPSNKSLAEKWISAIKNKELLSLLHEKKLSRSYMKVCKKHFTEKDFEANPSGKSQLVPNSVPSLFLPVETIETTNIQSSKPPKPVKRLQQARQRRFCMCPKVGVSLPISQHAIEFNDDAENEVVDADSVNEAEVAATTNQLLREFGEKSYNEWKATENKLLRKIRYLESTNVTLRKKLKKSKINDNTVINYLASTLNEMQLEFVKMQITNHGRPKRGRRYTQKQKSMCLAFYKQGPKMYRFQSKSFVLPTKKTLGVHSAKLIFKSGIDFKVLDAVKNRIKNWSEEDKYCVMSWDEVSLSENISYNHTRDMIDGFVELNNSRQPKFATHSLNFMVRGIKQQFKQTTGYFYTNGLMAFELVELVKLMIEATSTTGLCPILSVCDQVNVNANTVNLLINFENPPKIDGRLLIYFVNGRRMIHCWDPSHLIKVVRNNFEVKDLTHTITKHSQMVDPNTSGVSKSLQRASWDHISEVYRKDSESVERLLPNLRAEHLKPTKYKMRVSLATELFSNTCGTAVLQCIEEKQIPENFIGTANFLLFMNDFFDSINGSNTHEGNTLKCAVTENSVHFAFWEYALSILPKMSFINKSDGKVNNKSSVLKKLESTIKGYIEFSKTCFKVGIPSINIRDTSQDGLENFFGCVKGCMNTNKPTASGYSSGYGTMIINNITGTNSLRANCQQDSSPSLLDTIHEFVVDCSKEQSSDLMDIDEFITFEPNYNSRFIGSDEMVVHDLEPDEEMNSAEENVLFITKNVDDLIEFDPQFEIDSLSYFEKKALSRASTVVCQKLLKFTHCQDCKTYLNENEALFIENCTKVLCGLKEILPDICSEMSIKKKLLKSIETMKTGTLGCPDHHLEMTQKLKEMSAVDTILNFCYEINGFLSGKTRELPLITNQIQKLAFNQFDQKRKKRKIGKYSDLFIT